MAIRDHRPDLKQFILDLMCSGDGDIPLYLRVGDGNESDERNVCDLLADFKRQWQIDALFVADAALYTEENLQQMFHLRWVSSTRHPDCCKTLLENMPEEAFNDSVISGYRIAPCCSEYGGVQRWLVVESQARKMRPQTVVKSPIELRLLSQQEFACSIICSDCC